MNLSIAVVAVDVARRSEWKIIEDDNQSFPIQMKRRLNARDVYTSKNLEISHFISALELLT